MAAKKPSGFMARPALDPLTLRTALTQGYLLELGWRQRVDGRTFYAHVDFYCPGCIAAYNIELKKGTARARRVALGHNMTVDEKVRTVISMVNGNRIRVVGVRQRGVECRECEIVGRQQKEKFRLQQAARERKREAAGQFAKENYSAP